MNIRDWPMGRIMQLPDCCFGQRYLVTVSGVAIGAGPFYLMSKDTLPERCVVWSVSLVSALADIAIVTFVSVGLSDVIPTTPAEFQASGIFINGLGFEWLGRPSLLLQNHLTYRITLRQHVHSASRKIVVMLTAGGAISGEFVLMFEISSIPTEVPDCLLSL